MSSGRVEYIINLRDQVTGKMGRLTSSIDDSVKGVRRLQNRFQKLGKNGSDSVERVDNSVGRLIKSSNLLRNAIGMFGAYQLFRAGKGVLTLGANMEQTRVAFSTFLGDATKANEVIAGLNEFSNVTPFENEEVIKSGRVLLAAQIPVSKLQESLKSVGDIAAGANIPLTELSAIYSKAMNKGRVQAEELNQLSERGVPILQEFAKMYGVTTQEVMEMGSRGELTSERLTTAFQNMTGAGGMYFNMMEKQSQTSLGKFSTLVGKIKDRLTVFGESVNSRLNGVLDFAIGLVDGYKPLGDVFTRVWQAIQPLLASVWQLMGSFFGVSEEGASAEGTMNSLANIFNILRVPIEIVSAGLSALLNVINWLMPVLKPLIYLYGAWVAVQWALNVAMAANPIGLIITGIVLLVGAVVWVVKKIRENWDRLTAWFTKMVKFWATYLNPFGWLLQLVKVVFPNAYEKIMGWINKIIGGVKKALGWIKGLFGSKDKKMTVKVNEETGVVETNTTNPDDPEFNPEADAGGAATPALNNIAAGGTKQTNISLTIEKMIETFNVKPGEGQTWEDVEDKVLETLMRVLNSTNRMQTA